MKRAFFLILMLVIVLSAVHVCAEENVLYVDNRETDKIYPERLNLRSEPDKAGGLLGLYYTGTQVEVLGEEAGYKKVSIAGITGYMAQEYLITLEEAVRRYGSEEAFLAGRAAQVDLSGFFAAGQPLYSSCSLQSEARMTLASGDNVEIYGIVGDWAYVAAAHEGERVWGYLPLDVLVDEEARRVLIVAGKKADSQTNLYAQPADQAKILMALKNGASCLNVFGRSVGQWRKVRVGGVTGWIKPSQTENLAELGMKARNTVPYYPLVMQTKEDTLLYMEKENTELPYMTLGQQMKVEVLAESGDWVYVRTLEGGAGSSASGDYGYVKLDNLTLAAAGAGYGVAQVDHEDLPGLLYESPDAQSRIIGALCAGAQVRILSFTQTDYIQVAAAGIEAYIRKDDVRIISMDGDAVSERIPQRAAVRESVHLRGKPEKDAKQGEAIGPGQRVYVLGKAGDWALVLAEDTYRLNPGDDSDDAMGYVPLESISAPASTTHLSAVVSTDKVNLREKPDMSGEIIGRVRLEERLLIVDYGRLWTGVVTPEGERGYVKTEYLLFD